MSYARAQCLTVMTAALLAWNASAACAQAPQAGNIPRSDVLRNNAPQPGGTVSGRVFCTDTQRPAKFAEVQLLQANQNSRGEFAGGPARVFYASVAQGRTALDGGFSIAGVPAGDYIAVATAVGYLSPQQVAQANGEEPRGTSVHVDVNRTADVQVSMERGAVVSGRVLFDDGTPAPGAFVQLHSADAAGNLPAGVPGFARFSFGGAGQTDDRGVYRISGIAPGRYNVAVMMQTEGTERSPGLRNRISFPQTLMVYAPANMHRTDARVVEIRGTETVEGIDVQVALAGLHILRGSVQSRADGHPLNGGSVQLTDASDAAFNRVSQLEPDGTFALEYLPPGNYSLQVNGFERSDTRNDANGGVHNDAGRNIPPPTLTRYNTQKVSVIIGDHDVTLDPVMLDPLPAQTAPAPSTVTVH